MLCFDKLKRVELLCTKYRKTFYFIYIFFALSEDCKAHWALGSTSGLHHDGGVDDDDDYDDVSEEEEN